MSGNSPFSVILKGLTPKSEASRRRIMHDLKALIPYMARYRLRLAWGAFAIVVTTILTLMQPYLIGSAIDQLRNNRPQSEVVIIVLEILGLAALQNVGDFFA